MDAASILTRMAPGSRVSGIGTSRISKGFWNATTQAARLVCGMVLTRRPPQSEGDLLTRYDLRTVKEHNGGRRWQKLTAQGEGTLGDLVDGVTPASILHKGQGLLRRIDVHGNNQGRP